MREAQSTTMNSLALLGEFWWMVLAKSSLPVPVSPVTSTWAADLAAWATISLERLMAGLSPTTMSMFSGVRGFRALYLGVFYNVMIIATVTLAATKIGGVLLGLDPLTTVLIAGTVTMVYSATSGLWGVVATDLVLFVVAMIGSVAAAVFALRLRRGAGGGRTA